MPSNLIEKIYNELYVRGIKKIEISCGYAYLVYGDGSEEMIEVLTDSRPKSTLFGEVK